jgi:hypothetical protein
VFGTAGECRLTGSVTLPPPPPPEARLGLFAALLASLALCAAGARADASAPARPAPTAARGPAVELEGDPVADGPVAAGTAVLDLAFGTPLLRPPRGDTGPTLGYALEIAFVARTKLPVMLGVSLGGATFEESARVRVAGPAGEGPGTAVQLADAYRGTTLTTLAAVMRYQPYWGPARPFVELSAGPTFWKGEQSLTDAAGRTLASHEDVLAFGLLTSATLGVDVTLGGTRSARSRSPFLTDLSLTMGMRYWATTPLRHPALDGAAGERARTVLGAWVPIVALTWSVESHPEVVAQHRRR